MNTQGIYIYGIIPNFYPQDKFRELETIGVYTVSFQKISAIVSDEKVVDYTQLNRTALAQFLVNHQKTIEKIMDIGFSMIIPMQLGTFTANIREVREILIKGQCLINNILEEINNQIEIDIAATWTDFPKVLNQISSYPEIVRQKKQLLNSGKEITQSDQLKLGILIKKLLDGLKDDYSKRIKDALVPFCKQTKHNELMNDQMVLNSAFLIPKNELPNFDDALDKLDESFNEELKFKYVGPLPCYSFYTLEIKELHFEQVELAKNELGLKDISSDNEIKKAYYKKAQILHPDKNSDNGNSSEFDRIKNAYNTLREYSTAVRQTSEEDQIRLIRESVIENSLLIKIKD